MNILTTSITYVTSDTFFWPSMTFTALVGIFVAAVIYDGDTNQLQKGLATLFSYLSVLVVVTLSRVIPEVSIAEASYKPIAGLVTMFFVTLFYLFGVWWGVRVVKRAHK